MNLFSQLKERKDNPVKIGVIGAGKFSSMFLSQALSTPGMQIVGISELDPQKAIDNCKNVGWPEDVLVSADKADSINDAAKQGKTAITGNSFELIRSDCDIIIELTGNPKVGVTHAVESINAGKHLIMPNVETDCYVGPLLSKMASDKGLCFSMAYGDQPALIAEQIDWARTVGFDVVCAGKGTRYQPEFHESTPDTIWEHWGLLTPEMIETGGYNPKMFNSFLDGTKSAIEMCAVANASGLKPGPDGLKFPPVSVDNLQHVLKPVEDGGILPFSGMVECIASEDRFQAPIHNDLRCGVYVVVGAPRPYVKRCFAEYGMKTDKTGKYTAHYRPYHFIGLELGVSVASIAVRGEPTGTSRYFMADVVATAKKDLNPGEILDGEGGYTVFGTLLPGEKSLKLNALPLGLSDGVKVKKAVSKGQYLSYDDVESDESEQAFMLRRELETRVRNGEFSFGG